MICMAAWWNAVITHVCTYNNTSSMAKEGDRGSMLVGVSASAC